MPMEAVLNLNESMISALFKEILGAELPSPFQRLTYAEAMESYGSDKPDLRFDLKLHDVTSEVTPSEFKVGRILPKPTLSSEHSRLILLQFRLGVCICSRSRWRC